MPSIAKCLQDIAKKRQLAIVDQEEDATHMLHPVPEADDESYARAVFKRGEKCLVHFYRSVRDKRNLYLRRRSFQIYRHSDFLTVGNVTVKTELIRL